MGRAKRLRKLRMVARRTKLARRALVRAFSSPFGGFLSSFCHRAVGAHLEGRSLGYEDLARSVVDGLVYAGVSVEVIVRLRAVGRATSRRRKGEMH